MKERPILFSAPMVRAIRANQKRQTRRAWRNQPPDGVSIGYPTGELRSPYGQAGERLWVRETWAPQVDCELSAERWTRGINCSGPKPIVHFAADKVSEKPWVSKWRPSIHMPRWACRIELDITGLRIERLQAISEADALAEGIVQLKDGGYGLPAGEHYHSADPRQSYFSLWEAINGPGSVEANPWVWVVEFKRFQAPGAAPGDANG